MKKEYTMFDLLTMGVACMASLESENALTKLLILAGAMAWIEGKNAVCDKLMDRKEKQTDHFDMPVEKNSKVKSACRKVSRIFQPHTGLYYPRDLALDEVKKSGYSLSAKAQYLANHSEYIRNLRIEKIAKAVRKGTPLSATEIKKWHDAEDRTRFDAYKEILTLKYENVR